MPSPAARRWTIRHASMRLMGFSVSALVRPAAERNRRILAPSPILAASILSVAVLLQIMMRQYLVAFAAFFVQTHPPALSLRVIVLDAHGDDGADPGKGIGHGGDQRPVAPPDDGRGVDAVQPPRACSASGTAVLPILPTCFGPRTAWAGLVATTWPVTSHSGAAAPDSPPRPAFRCIPFGHRVPCAPPGGITGDRGATQGHKGTVPDDRRAQSP